MRKNRPHKLLCDRVVAHTVVYRVELVFEVLRLLACKLGYGVVSLIAVERLAVAFGTKLDFGLKSGLARMGRKRGPVVVVVVVPSQFRGIGCRPGEEAQRLPFVKLKRKLTTFMMQPLRVASEEQGWQVRLTEPASLIIEGYASNP